MRRRVIALLGLVVAALIVAVPTSAATSHDGPCVGTEGVTVVADFSYFPGVTTPVVRCALGSQPDGLKALDNAGFTREQVPGQAGTVCTLNGYPTQGYPVCWTQGGYWSYWTAGPTDSTWNYSQLGAANRTPALGGSEGWKFVAVNVSSTPPLVGPHTFTTPTPTPATTSAAAPARFTVTTSAALVATGGSLRVTAAGLAAGESYTVLFGNDTLATGAADSAGSATNDVVIPAKAAARLTSIIVRGSGTDRVGEVGVRVVSATRKLTVKRSAATVRKRRSVKITVKGLAAGERVTLRVGRTRRAAVASSAGTASFALKFTSTGVKRITVTGLTATRRGTIAVRVVR